MDDSWNKLDEAWGELLSAMDALVGCVMFASLSSFLADRERLVNALHDASQKVDNVLMTRGG